MTIAHLSLRLRWAKTLNLPRIIIYSDHYHFSLPINHWRRYDWIAKQIPKLKCSLTKMLTSDNIIPWNCYAIWPKITNSSGQHKYCIQLWIRPVICSPYGDLRLICPVLNSPTRQFSYPILYKLLNWPSFCPRVRGRKIKREWNFPCIQ